MTAATPQAPEHRQQELLERLAQHPVASWSSHLAGFVLNAMDLEASGELEGMLHVPNGDKLVLRVQVDTSD
jgi:hypothetical protein